MELTVKVENDEDQPTVISKLHKVLLDSNYPIFKLDEKFKPPQGIRLTSSDKSRIVIHPLKESGYHIHFRSPNADESVRMEANSMINKIIDFFAIIPTLVIKMVEAEADIMVPKHYLQMLKIVEPQTLLKVAEKTNLVLSAYSIGLATEFEKWDMLYLLLSGQDKDEKGVKDRPQDMIFLHRDFEGDKKNIIDNIYETANHLEEQLKLAEEAISTAK